MKYLKPTFEKTELETNDVVSASRNGSMTVGDVTVEGPQDDFSMDFGDLAGR